jgi:hypothetical protein
LSDEVADEIRRGIGLLKSLSLDAGIAQPPSTARGAVIGPIA